MENQCLAIPCVPVQQWGRTYDPAKALEEGTVFPELNKPFFAAPENSNSTLPADGNAAIKFSQICFVLDDVLLYLDTHPDDGEARQFYEDCLKEKKEMLREAKCGCSCADHFEWEQKPLVWEGGHC